MAMEGTSPPDWLRWRNSLPSSWEVAELRRVAEISASNVDKNMVVGEIPVRLCNYTDVYYNDSIGPELEFMEASATAGEVAKFGLHGGEVILTKDSETAADIAIPSFVRPEVENLVCGYHLYVLRPHVERLDGRFLRWALDVAPIRDQYVVAAKGITRYGLGGQDLAASLVPLPPLSLQEWIADFLDRETAKIEALIGQRQRLIELLTEERASLVTRTVTRGLDSTIELKDSGTVWFGLVPSHWRVVQLRFLVRPGTSITYGIVQAGPDVADGIPYIRTGDMSGASLPETGYKRTSAEIDRAYSRSKVQTGDIVVAIRASVGKALSVPAHLDGANLTQGTAKISPGRQLDSRFLLFVLESELSQQRFSALAKGATFKEITLDMLRRFVIPLPPLEEQRQIASYLSERVGQLDRVLAEAKRGIDLLREYRSALISAAVTGKIDVREHAS